MHRFLLAFIAISFVIFTELPIHSVEDSLNPQPADDILLYRNMDFDRSSTSLMTYNPATNEHITLIEEFGGNWRFNVDGNGRIAYVSESEGNQDIYVMDVLADPPTSINISNTPDTPESQLWMGWNPEGTTLAFVSGEADKPGILYAWIDEQLFAIDFGWIGWVSLHGDYIAYTKDEEDSLHVYIFDGENTTDITPVGTVAEPISFGFDWSLDHRLAMTTIYRQREYAGPTGHSEVFLWDGENTVKVPNPNTDEQFMSSGWSSDGQLALRTTQDYVSKIYIWDGISLADNGVPDVESFVYVSDGFRSVYHSLWTPDNQLLFNAIPPDSVGEQYYLWNGEQAVDYSQTPGLHTFGATWSRDGRWAFTSDFHEAGAKATHVRDANNQIIATLPAPGYGAPKWGANGNIAFCRGATLVVWDGEEVIEVSSDFAVTASWLYEGGNLTCSIG